MGKLEATIALLLGVICFAASASLNKSHVDELSLLSIKAHINSDILASNWSEETSFCTWAGITCGKRHPHRVTRLDLSDMDLRGTIAKEIGNLTFLRFLDISNNSISSLIPGEIGLLRKLQALNLSNNYLSGNIPTSLSACVELKVFDLSHNNLSGAFLVGFGNWSQLQEMSLKSNSLTGMVPLSIGNLSNLEVFDISENSFYGTVLWELGQLSSLRILNLQANNLSGEVPPAIFNLSMLQFLSLRENNLSGTLPFSIDKGLPNIQQIFLGNIERRFDLRANQFSGKIPDSIANLSKLVTLDLSDNSFTHVPTSLGNLQQLQMLNLEANHLTNNLSNPELDFLSSLAACKNLKFIAISFNPITGILPKSLGSSNLSVSLETFKAFSCRILDPIPDEIGNLSSLLWLNLGYNHFADAIPTTLGRLRSLMHLEIDGNRFHGSISPVLCSLNHLCSLNLAINSLSGELPSCLGNISSLREIYLSHNDLNSSIGSVLWFHKGVSSMKSLITLDLSGNQLSGEIPGTISQLRNLNRLSLSRNKLKGRIGENFADLKDLQHLDLSHNYLDGPIPRSFETLPRLNYFDVSYNELSGEIPERGCFVNFTAEFFIGNKGLCGAPRFNVKKCKSLSMEKLLSYISVLIVVVIGLAVVVLVWRVRAWNRSLPDYLPYITNWNEILHATGDEENLISRGSVGSVYKAYISNDVYAVKVFNLDVHNSLKSFNTECQILSIVKHRNLVKMMGYYSKIDFKAFVMTYMPNGDLEKWLHSSICSLSLLERLRVMIDVASAMQYLHEDLTPPVVHCDLHPRNIFLDEDMVAHVGDFGIAKILSEEERIQLHSRTLGTVGYIAPEYGSQGLISTTVDVYSYGVLLMEMLSRRKPTDDLFTGELTLRRWVLEAFPHSVRHIVDNELLDTDNEEARFTYESLLRSLIRLALECTSDLPEERPNMRDVRTRIQDINAFLQVKLGHFVNTKYLFAGSDLAGFIEDTNFENLEVLEKANVENAEQHDRFKVITCKAIVRPIVMSQCLNNSFHQLECRRDNTWEDTYKKFLLSSEEMNVGVGYGVSAQYFIDIENVNVDFEEHHINAYLAILHDDPEFAGLQKPRRRVAIVDTMFSANLQEIWMVHNRNSKTLYSVDDLSFDELEFLLQYVRGERPMWRNSTNWFDCDEVIVVYNFSEHWVVCKLNLTSCTIHLFDSFQHTFTNMSRIQRVVDTGPLAHIVPVLLKRSGFWEHRMDLQPRLTRWPVKIPKQTNAFVQTDSHSGGPFALMNVEAILTGRMSPNGAQERILAYRQHIAHTIFRFSSKNL